MAVAEKARSPRRAELVEVAARLFSQRGYHGTSMQDLGSALGIQRGSLYAHIGSKEELLFDVVTDGAERFLARGHEAISRGGSARDRLRAFLVGHVETATQHLEASTVFLNEWRYLSQELRDLVQAKRDTYEAMARRIVEEGVASREFLNDTDVRFAARLVLSAGNWTYTWYRPDGDLTPTEIGERFAELVTRGLEA